MDRTAIGRAMPLVAALGLALIGCTKPPAPVEQPASNEPGPPPATPVVPVQSQPLNEPSQ